MKIFASALFTSVSLLASVASAQGTKPTATATPTTLAATPPPATKAATAPAATVKTQAHPMPTPAPEIAMLAKTIGGKWKCTGSITMADGSAQPMKSTISYKLNSSLRGFWIDGSFVQSGKGGFAFASWTTYDPSTKLWHRLQADNMGSQEVGTSDGLKDNKVLWNSTSRSSMGTAAARHHEEIVGTKEAKLWGEYSLDKGKTWTKTYEATCKR